MRNNVGIRTSYGRGSDTQRVIAGCASSIGPSPVELVLAFVGGLHDPLAALVALREAFPGACIVGGSAAGVITREGYGYGGLEIGLTAFPPGEMAPKLVVDDGLLAGEVDAGRRLGRAIAAVASEDAPVLLLFDSVAETTPLRLHPASLLVSGINEGLGGRRVHLIGGGLLTDLNITDGWLFDGEAVRQHAVAALVFPASVEAATVICHGCRPASSFMRITRIDGAVVHELDGLPALGVIEQRLGIAPGSSSAQALLTLATLGQKQGDPFTPFDENLYVNRLILRGDQATGSITLFEPDFEVGTQVQIMTRDNVLMLDSVARGAEAMNALVSERDCLLGFYIDCAGRASMRSGASSEEAEHMLTGLSAAVPLTGFYSGVEIAPFADGLSRPLDWTGVLTVLQARR